MNFRQFLWPVMALVAVVLIAMAYRPAPQSPRVMPTAAKNEPTPERSAPLAKSRNQQPDAMPEPVPSPASAPRDQPPSAPKVYEAILFSDGPNGEKILDFGTIPLSATVPVQLTTPDGQAHFMTGSMGTDGMSQIDIDTPHITETGMVVHGRMDLEARLQGKKINFSLSSGSQNYQVTLTPLF